MAESDLPSRAEVERRILDVLRGSLPPTWSLETQRPIEEHGVDLFLVFSAPASGAAIFGLELKTAVEGRDVRFLAERLARAGDAPAKSVVGARYLSPPVRDRLTSEGLGYVDTTGNLRIAAARPGLFISRQGADADPWRGPGRPRGTLKGEPAARIVRTIVDIKDDWTARELAETAGVSTGATYRVMEFLEREGLAERVSGRLIVHSWVPLLRRWSEDYGFVRNSHVTRWLAPRGLEGFQRQMGARTGVEYALTGTIAAAEWAPYAPSRSALVYVTEPHKCATLWGLRPTESAANVLLAEPEFTVPFIRKRPNAEGLQIAAPAQVAADMMTGPGRNPTEAEELIEWMAQNEPSWRG